MRELYTGDSPYQIMNILNIVYHKQEAAERILFVMNQFRTAEHLVKKIEESKLFSGVYLLREDKVKFMSRGVKRYSRLMFDFLTPKLFMKSLLKDYPNTIENLLGEKFDVIYAATAIRHIAAMVKLNPDADFILFDDGTGSYSGNIIMASGSRLNLIFCKIFNVGSYVCKPSKLLVNNVSMCRSTAVPQDKIFQLPELDKGFVDFCNSIFEMKRERKNSVFWLSQPIDFQPGAAEAREEVQACLLPYKDKITVRMHPLDFDHEFYQDFTIDYGHDMWELSLLNEKENADSLILIGGYSTAQVTPKLLFDMEPILIFTHQFNNQKQGSRDREEMRLSIGRRIEDLRKTYRNPEKIYNPKTAEELSIILQKLIL